MSEEIGTTKQDDAQAFLARRVSAGIVVTGAMLCGTVLLAQIAPHASTDSVTTQSRHSDLVDVHHHYAITEYIAEVHPKSPLSTAIRTWNLEKTLAEMEKTGTATAILSVSSPGLWFGDPAVTRKIARNCNDYAAGIVKTTPSPGAFAAMPLPNIHASLKEIDIASTCSSWMGSAYSLIMKASISETPAWRLYLPS